MRAFPNRPQEGRRGDERRGQAHRHAASDGALRHVASGGNPQSDGGPQEPDDELSFGEALIGRENRGGEADAAQARHGP